MRYALIIGAGLLVAQPALVAAKTYKCVDAKGNVFYSQTLLPECQGQKVQELNKRGIVTKETAAPPKELDPKATEEQRAREAEEAQKAREQERHDKALLATYANAEEIDLARDRNLQHSELVIKSNETRLKAVQARLDDYLKQAEKYKAAGKPVPADLHSDVESTQAEKQKLLVQNEQKQKEMEEIRARYAQDKKRFVELKEAPPPR